MEVAEEINRRIINGSVPAETLVMQKIADLKEALTIALSLWKIAYSPIGVTQLKRYKMQPITRNDIIEELERVKTDKEFKEVLKKYPSRIFVSYEIKIDHDKYCSGDNWCLDNNTGGLDEHER
jgi:hypothetical protein